MSTYTPKHFTVTFPQEYIAHVEINRPQKLNAFFEEMWLELRTLFETLSPDPSVRVIILSGTGKAFTAGLDVQAASTGLLAPNETGDPARKAAHLRRHISSFQACISAIEHCEKPVIAAMHGFALGLAVDIATAADIRICAADTRFAVKEVDIGLAADIGTLSRLPKVVGSFGWVKDVALSARLFGADEALRVGFVSSVFEDKEVMVQGALEMAGLIASKSPVAVQGTKEILNWSRDRPVEDGLRYTSVWNSAALQTQDVQTALLSGIQKRKATFEKL
ncbi:ClpP/crotonase-like domain-containing protein [Aspergillus avenaceus]|uniref:ClpP/crotonase-like domain-containing protein n=1 Tax=Aspergillus avenaceus TaxID=36643 RepID=A0A5N6U3I2_ASPAV|nr:ClpP/crotonase-like domain-containing protein [Aspergillus avenaceus]